MFEASLNCEIEPGAISGRLTTTHDLFRGHEKPRLVSLALWPSRLRIPCPTTIR
jgi:hypothetical protein